MILIKTTCRLMKLPAFVAGLMICYGSLAARGQTNWTLVWADEFTQANGTAPDSAKWAYDIGTGSGGWGNNEKQYYTARTNNVRIENNQLVIEARQESYMGSGYTSARLKTQGKASWTYGRMEARLKLARGQGIWPAFWMLGTNITSVKWPTCGEIDILENIGREPTIIHGTVHGPGYAGGNGIGGGYSLPGNPVFADDFHVYAIEWTPDLIKWFVDGTQYFSITPASLPPGAPWVFNQPEYLLLNLAVGGNWPGYPDGTTVFPQRLTVDYVRVYAISNAPASGALRNGGFDTGALASGIGPGFATANP
jgi:beta-glucanase (GH16 family)